MKHYIITLAVILGTLTCRAAGPLRIQQADVNPILCGTTGVASVTLLAKGGSGKYLYSVDSGTPTESNVFENLSSGSHHFTVQDEENPSVSTAIGILVGPTDFSHTTLKLIPDCTNATQGIISVDTEGGESPFSYFLYINGEPTPIQEATDITEPTYTFLPVPEGTYAVENNDVNTTPACLDGFFFVLVLPEALNAVITTTPYGVVAGTITVTPTGGTEPYSVSLSNRATFEDVTTSVTFSSLNAGSYEVVITDFNGCTFSQAITVTNAIADYIAQKYCQQ